MARSSPWYVSWHGLWGPCSKHPAVRMQRLTLRRNATCLWSTPGSCGRRQVRVYLSCLCMVVGLLVENVCLTIKRVYNMLQCTNCSQYSTAVLTNPHIVVAAFKRWASIPLDINDISDYSGPPPTHLWVCNIIWAVITTNLVIVLVDVCHKRDSSYVKCFICLQLKPSRGWKPLDLGDKHSSSETGWEKWRIMCAHNWCGKFEVVSTVVLGCLSLKVESRA